MILKLINFKHNFYIVLHCKIATAQALTAAETYRSHSTEPGPSRGDSVEYECDSGSTAHSCTEIGA